MLIGLEIMSSWMSCALMPLNFTSDYVWSRWYFGLSTTAAPLCSTYSICVSSISVSLHVSWRRTCHWWKRISNQIAFLWLCCFLTCHQWFPNRNGQVHIPCYECMTNPAQWAFNYLDFRYSLLCSSGERAWGRGLVNCFNLFSFKLKYTFLCS